MVFKLVLWVTCAANLLALALGLALAECPNQCKCGENKVDCSHVELDKFPVAIPANATIVNLVGNNIQELDRSALVDLQAVQQLCLQSNSLTKLNSEIFKTMMNLVRLDISYNQITDVHKRAFTGLSQLSALILNGNQINKINGAFSRTQELTFLNLADNKLTEIAEEEFAKITKLKYLDLGSNLITTIHPKAFENLKELRYLILQNNKITSLGVLSFNSRLLSVVDFTNNALVRMPRGLPKSVTDLRSGHNKIESIDKEDLSNMTRLQLLTLNDNSIAQIDDNAFEDARNLKEIWLTSNKLTSLPKTWPSGLVKLFVNSNKIRKIEKDAFNGNRHLEYLTMQMNELAEISPKTLSQLKSLTYLNLQGNQLTQLSRDVFVGMNRLQSMTLANNPIASIEAKSLDNLDELIKLDMSYNELKGIQLHMNIFKAMPKLKELNLMNSPGLVEKLLAQIKDSKISTTETVQIIDLQYNNLLNLPILFPSIFPNLTMLKLTNNAWHCNSSLIPLKRYLEIPKITFAENLDHRPVCYTPYKLKGRAITEVPDEEFLSASSDKEGEGKEGEGKASRSDLVKGEEEEEANQLPAGGDVDSKKTSLSVMGVEVKNTGEGAVSEPKSRKKRRKGSRKGNKKSREERKKRRASRKKRRRRRHLEEA